MKYEIKDGPGTAEITLDGRLTFTEAALFPRVLGDLAKAGQRQWNFHLGQLEFIDSTGMSLFVHVYDAALKSNSKVAVFGASGNVRAAMERAAFHTLFDIK